MWFTTIRGQTQDSEWSLDGIDLSLPLPHVLSHWWVVCSHVEAVQLSPGPLDFLVHLCSLMWFSLTPCGQTLDLASYIQTLLPILATADAAKPECCICSFLPRGNAAIPVARQRTVITYRQPCAGCWTTVHWVWRSSIALWSIQLPTQISISSNGKQWQFNGYHRLHDLDV